MSHACNAHAPTACSDSVVDICDSLILGRSEAIQRVRELIRRVAPWPLPVLIEGPTGAGKELVAAAIHKLSGRCGQLATVNVCAIPETLFEATILGYTRGAFTGAHQDAPGYVLEAHRGTLFLDEISGLPVAMQAKLLRVLETGMVRPIGGKHDRASDFRVLTASNERLSELITAGRLRRDFFHRIRGAVIAVPPLVQRLEDIEVLVPHFAKLAAFRVGLPAPTVKDSAMRVLATHTWPGNIRELRQVVETALMLSDGQIVTAREVRESIGHLNEIVGVGVRSSDAEHLTRLLERHGWNVASAAHELDVTPKTIYSRLQRAGVALPRRATVTAPRP